MDDTNNHVLIVEDEYAIASGLRMLLEGEGCTVDLAPTIERAKVMLLRKPKWVILDVMLPDGEGTEVLRHIREANLSCRVVVTTGMVDRQARERIMALNPASYMEKPVEIDTLFRLIGLT